MVKTALMGIALAATPAIAAARETPRDSPVIDAISACRATTDAAQRLACYDRAAARLDAARQNREIVVIDREEVQKTKRTLFGLSLPHLDIFSGGKPEEDEEEIKEISAKIAAASVGSDGNWLLRLEDGAKWHQTDGKMIASRPRPGSTALIRRGALGSFILRVDNQPGVKVRREN